MSYEIRVRGQSLEVLGLGDVWFNVKDYVEAQDLKTFDLYKFYKTQGVSSEQAACAALIHTADKEPIENTYEESDYTIILYQKEGSPWIDWYTVSHYGPFSSKAQREAWEKENPLDENERYVVEFLTT